MTEQEQRDFERRSRAAFDASVAALDGATCSRLTRARHAALGQFRQRSVRVSGWLPAGALAAAAVVAVTLWTGREPAPGPGATAALATLDDLELLAAGEDFEMLGEDAAFYAWAADALADGVG
ncbi:MAG: DUF3619 family protein [Gammaproteobacteria bacterium]|nr:MAG: DUF3619 family protein [Gammaproteobacteria bacterium]